MINGHGQESGGSGFATCLEKVLKALPYFVISEARQIQVSNPLLITKLALELGIPDFWGMICARRYKIKC